MLLNYLVNYRAGIQTYVFIYPKFRSPLPQHFLLVGFQLLEAICVDAHIVPWAVMYSSGHATLLSTLTASAGPDTTHHLPPQWTTQADLPYWLWPRAHRETAWLTHSLPTIWEQGTPHSQKPRASHELCLALDSTEPLLRGEVVDRKDLDSGPSETHHWTTAPV